MFGKFDRQQENEAGITRRVASLFMDNTLASSAVQMEHNSIVLTWADGSEYVLTVEQIAGSHAGIIRSIQHKMHDLGERIRGMERSS